AEAAGAEGAVDVGKRIGKANAGVLLGQQVRRVAAVTLPAVGRPAAAPTTDHITVVALVADPAPGDVVDHHSVTGPELLAARPHLDDLPARLVTRDHALVALGALAQMLAVDRPDVAAANGRGLHPHQNLAVAGFGDRVFLELDGAVARQDDARHGCSSRGRICYAHELVHPSRFQGGVISPPGSHRSSHLWPSFHRNT